MGALGFSVALPPTIGFTLSFYGHGEFASVLNTGYAIFQLSPLLVFGFFAQKMLKNRAILHIPVAVPLIFFLILSMLSFAKTADGYSLVVFCSILTCGINFTTVRLLVHRHDFAWARLQVLRPILFFVPSLSIYGITFLLPSSEISGSYIVFLSLILPAIFGLRLLSRWINKSNWRENFSFRGIDLRAALSTVAPVFLSFYERLFSFGYHQSPRYYLCIMLSGIAVFAFDSINRMLIHKLYGSKNRYKQALYGISNSAYLGSISTLIIAGLVFFGDHLNLEEYQILIFSSFLFLGSSFPMQSSIFAIGANYLLSYANISILFFLGLMFFWTPSEKILLSLMCFACVSRYLAMLFILLSEIRR